MKKIFKIALIILCAFGASCSLFRGEPPSLYKVTETNKPLRQCNLPILYKINDNVPLDTRTAIINAFNYWDDLSNEKLFLFLGITNLTIIDSIIGDTIIVEIEEHKPYKDGLAYVHRNWFASGCLFGGGIRIYRDTFRLPIKGLESVLRHEVGHVLGFGHSPLGSDLMHESIRPSKYLKGASEWEIKAFNIYYNRTRIVRE